MTAMRRTTPGSKGVLFFFPRTLRCDRTWVTENEAKNLDCESESAGAVP